MSKEIKQYAIVYHETYGKGRILEVKFRPKDSLVFCSFGKGRHGFITEKQLRRGDGEITLSPTKPKTKRKEMSLEEALQGLMGGGGDYPPMD